MHKEDKQQRTIQIEVKNHLSAENNKLIGFDECCV
jgi:hypothetical protein